VLAERGAHIPALGGQKGVGHTAANGQLIELADQIAEQLELGRDLGPADDAQDRPARLAEGGVQRLQFGPHGLAGMARQKMGESLGGGVGPVRGGKGVVDVQIAVASQGAGELRIVGLFAGVKAQIFQQQYVAIAQPRHRRSGAFADTIVGEGDWRAQQF
jgi:hypothetical protein